MKKSLVFAALIFIAVSSLFASNLDSERFSMGNLKAAMNSESVASFENPALMAYYDQAHKVLIGMGTSFETPSAFPYVQNSGASIVFVGDNMSLDVDLLWYPIKQANGLYTLRHRLSAETMLSYKAGNFAFGIGFAGASEKERKDVLIEEKLFSGLVSETYFGRYRKVEDSEEIELSAGVAYENGGFTFAVLCENLFETSDASEYNISLNSVAESLDVGAFYKMDRFNKRGRLRKSVVSLGVEGQSLWAVDKRTVNAGIKYMFQFNRNLSAFIMTGTEIRLSDVKNGSVHMIGLGMENNPVKVTVSAKIPYALYVSSRESAIINVILGLSF